MDQRLPGWTVDVTANTDSLKRSLEDVGRLGDRFAARLTDAFEQVAIRGRKLEDVVRSLALGLSQMALKAAFQPIENALGGLFQNLFSGLAGATAGAGSGLPVPFAKGGVIASPVTFPLGGNRTGLAGERGAEAILPLARGPDGRLGVRAEAGGGVHVTFNVSTPDVDGFRRSESQIAALLQRSLASGQRNL